MEDAEHFTIISRYSGSLVSFTWLDFAPKVPVTSGLSVPKPRAMLFTSSSCGALLRAVVLILPSFHPGQKKVRRMFSSHERLGSQTLELPSSMQLFRSVPSSEKI